ncbi:MAG: ribulose 1,5-bisphosphate carboxylase large subunit [Proteobacteria bacterium]|nr:ribulose 1,5-bisphosphate carboxylase large subunit [Pseudomonadota bacterium]
MNYNPLFDAHVEPRPDDDDSLILTWAYRGSDPESFARDIAVEQSIEFPAPYVRSREILDNVIPRILSIESDEGFARIRMSFNPEIARPDFVQLLNVLFGNVSMKDDVKLIDIQFPLCLTHNRGPRFGVDGIRQLTKAKPGSPVLASALKPMGLSVRAFCTVATRFVEMGMHIIKDDHGLSNQAYAPFEERVRDVSEAVALANEKYGRSCLYAPNISGPVDEIFDRARFAKKCGAGALMVAPGLMGYDVIRALRDADLGLPVLSHPSFLGMCALNPLQGMTHAIAFGTLNRLAGADVIIFPNHGGRFAFSKTACQSIFDASLGDSLDVLPSLPAPAGGMKVNNIEQIARDYGTAEFAALIGGDMYRQWAENTSLE